MAAPTPVDWTTVPVPEAQHFNENVRDIYNVLLNSPSAGITCDDSVVQQVIQSGAWEPLQFDTLEWQTHDGMALFDTYATFDSQSGWVANRLIALHDGVYRVQLQVPWTLYAGVEPTYLEVAIGTSLTDVSTIKWRSSTDTQWTGAVIPAYAGLATSTVTGLVPLAAGEYVVPWVFQNTGRNQVPPTNDPANRTRFHMDWICSL